MEFPEKTEYFKKNKDGTKQRICSYRKHPGDFMFFPMRSYYYTK